MSVRPILTVTTPATDPLLLTEAEARQAVNVPTGQDAKILQLRKIVSDAITSRCNVWASGAVAPTLRLETVSQQIRLINPVEQIRLVRRPVIEILSVTEDGTSVDAADYELDAAAGLLRRLYNDWPSYWMGSAFWVGSFAPTLKIVVSYRAGWETVPDSLRSAAMRFALSVWTKMAREPGLKGITIPDVIQKEFWVGPSNDPLMSFDIDELLGDYINPVMA